MYNEEVKIRYISYALEISTSQNKSNYERGLINRFNRSASFEECLGKDILYMSQEEILTFLKDFLKGGKDYQVNTISMIKSYCEWGIQNDLTLTRNNWLKNLKVTDIDISGSYADSMVKDENDLINCFNTIFPPLDLDTVGNLFRCILLLIFWGIDKEDVWYLKESDINFETQTIKYKSSELKMSNALYKIVSYIMNMKEIKKEGKAASEYGKDIIKQGYLISNTKTYNSEEERRRMRATYTTSLSQILSDCERSLTNTTIADSGVFYRMFLKEQETGEVDCLEYLRARRTQPATINTPDRVKGKCRHEYNTWKRAFNL